MTASRGMVGRLAATRLDDVASRRAWVLAVATAAGTVFAPIDYTPLKWVTVPDVVAVLLLVAAVVTVAAARLRLAPLLLAPGVVLLVAGLFRLATYGYGRGLIGGASSTAALLTALGIAHIAVFVAATSPRDSDRARARKGAGSAR